MSFYWQVDLIWNTKKRFHWRQLVGDKFDYDYILTIIDIKVNWKSHWIHYGKGPNYMTQSFS